MPGVVKVVRFRDRGLEAIMKRVSASGNLGVRVGVLEPQAGGQHPLRRNITVGEVAIINEFGSRRARVPRRSFLKSTFEASRDTLKRGLIRAARQVVEQQVGPRAALQPLGYEMVEEVKRTIEGGVTPPPNADQTIRDKGHDLTLMHTETLLHAITHDIVAKRGNTLTPYRDEGYEGADSVGVDEGEA
jgi:hypothetical protein